MKGYIVKIFVIILFANISLSSFAVDSPIHSLKIHAPEFIVGEQFAEIRLEALKLNSLTDSSVNGKREILINREVKVVEFIDGIAFTTIEIANTSTFSLQIKGGEKSYNFTIRYLPPWLSIFPPLLAILLALLTKEVITSLFISIFFGVLTLKGFEFSNVVPSLFTVVDTYLLDTLKDTKHISVIIFSFMVGGMVALISHNGGMRGIASKLSKYAHSPRSAQFMAFVLSLGIFFDNYANTLIVGNTMRPVTDRYKVSREKLAFIVHSAAASITAIAFLSTWIGAELGYINDATANLGIPDKTYSLFLKSLQFAFYPILMLFFLFFLIIFKRDFGPMNLAEIEARNAGVMKKNMDREKRENEDIKDTLKLLEPDPGGRFSWLTAFIPILAFVIIAFISLIITGARHAYENLLYYHIHLPEYTFGSVWKNLPILQPENKNNFFSRLGVLISYSDFYIALLWSSFTGVVGAIILTVIKKGISLRATMENLVHGFRIMLSAIIILVFAWTLARILEDLHTTDYIVSIISAKLIFPQILPVIIFLLAAFFSFATGSVWGTMAILYPLIIPVSWSLSLHTGLSIEESKKILYMVISAIIAGSVFGNQCSPISDTTTLSSISSNCDHVAHIKTQMPYAITIASITLFLLFFSLIGLHWLINYLLGIGLILLVLKYRGKVLD